MNRQFDIDLREPKLPRVIEPIKLPEANTYCDVITEYNEDYCESIIRHCSEGGSVESYAGKEYICPDAMMEWVNEHIKFKAAVKIALSAEFLYWENLCRFARDNILDYKDILPTINRKLAQLEGSLSKNGLRKSMYTYEEPTVMDKNKKEDLLALEAMEAM